nr:MAG TPA: hypothetical protein [Bacteriophage sp.]
MNYSYLKEGTSWCDPSRCKDRCLRCSVYHYGRYDSS